MTRGTKAAIAAISWMLVAMTGCPADDDDDVADDSSEGGSDPSASAGATTAGSTTAGSTTAGSTTAGSTTAGSTTAGSTTASSTTEAEDTGESSGGTDTETGGAPASLLGHVHRDAAATIADGNDGVGTLYVAAFGGCAEDAMLAGFAIVDMADVSSPDAVVDFTIANLVPGEYDLRVFLDDNGTAMLPTPAPDPGDLVADPDLADEGATCNMVTMDGVDLDAELTLTVAIPAA